METQNNTIEILLKFDKIFVIFFLVPEALLRLSRYRCREAKNFRVPTAQLCTLPLFFLDVVIVIILTLASVM